MNEGCWWAGRIGSTLMANGARVSRGLSDPTLGDPGPISGPFVSHVLGPSSRLPTMSWTTSSWTDLLPLCNPRARTGYRQGNGFPPCKWGGGSFIKQGSAAVAHPRSRLSQDALVSLESARDQGGSTTGCRAGYGLARYLLRNISSQSLPGREWGRPHLAALHASHSTCS